MAKEKKIKVKKKTGAPPTTISDPDIIELGKEMIEQINAHPDWLFIQEFANYKNMSLKTLYHHYDRIEFKDYYDRAKQILGIRIVKQAGRTDDKKCLTGLHPALASRFVGVYFNDIKSHELEMKAAKEAQGNTYIYTTRTFENPKA